MREHLRGSRELASSVLAHRAASRHADQDEDLAENANVADVVLVVTLLTEEMPLHLLVAETGPKGRASSRASTARREAAGGP
ncbi:MAG: hypothetical protein EDX89_24150 [Acidobacteria bacterium]|nr:MAG: hypothetical protein EDX89_24150 [Acidobacteriota bacterium]MCE7957648.1 hypothetical protein [Acidobacteria bacterium ACB2]